MSHDKGTGLDPAPLLDHLATALASVRDEAALVAAMDDITRPHRRRRVRGRLLSRSGSRYRWSAAIWIGRASSRVSIILR
jgi:hypothetical protein